MTLTAHGVVGAAAAVAATAALGTSPMGLTAAFAAGFASHFAIDAIPHWQEGIALLRSVRVDPRDRLTKDMVLNKHFVRDLFVVGVDALLGLALALLIFCTWLFHISPYIVFLGVVAGDLPDALQFVYFKTRLSVMTPLQKFHNSIQTELKNPLFLIIEAALMAALIALLKIFM